MPAFRGAAAPLALALGLVLGACATAGRSGDPDAPVVVTSFYPLAFAAERVAGPHAVVEDLTPPGVEPHDLELSPAQVGALHEADLVFYLGGGFQPAVEDVVAGLDTRTIDVLGSVDALASPDSDEGDADPHVWLDPQRMQDIVRAIAEQLAAVDPVHSATYERNADEAVAALADLDEEISATLARCAGSALVVSHEAFAYLAARYDLEQVGIAGLDPEAEPSPQRLAEAIRFAEANNVKTIFFESLVDPAVAETVAREIGAHTAVLDPLESAPPEGDYLDAMRTNLAALRSGLRCA